MVASVAVSARHVDVLGLQTLVRWAGDQDSEEAAVFLHGNPGSSADWEQLLGATGDFARAVAFDFPGYGKSDKPKDWDYGAGGIATFIAAALQELGISRVHLVMHDLGGVGLLWAAAHADALKSVVLIDTGALIGFRWHPVARLYRLRGVGELLAAMTTRPGFRLVMRLYNPQPRKLARAHVDRMYDDYSWAARRAALAFYRASPPSGFERLIPIFHALDPPALVLWGAHDPAVPVAQANLQRQSFPSAEIVVLEDSGHWPYLDDPQRSAEAILPFLAAQIGQAAQPVA